jgi:7,8-dihydropterin-6-yl-methyl-4-(beta-D-ribofuranosyl)aminobenzene 5'-phosphate synthase
MDITIIYDNYGHDPRLQTAWGFSCLIERGPSTILFDTGGDGAILLANMATLGFDPQNIDSVVLSHIHGDHTGGLAALLTAAAHPTVYAPRSFPEEFKARIRSEADLLEVHGPQPIADGVYTTGEMGSAIVEQALVLDAGQESVVITGCAHPGIAAMVRQAEQVTGKPAGLVLGGFHLKDASEPTIQAVVDEFVAMGVGRVAPSHCTGDQAIALFRKAYGTDYIASGCGHGFDIAYEVSR